MVSDNNIIPFKKEKEEGSLETLGWSVTFHYQGQDVESGYTFSTLERAVAYCQSVVGAHYLATEDLVEWSVFELEGTIDDENRADAGTKGGSPGTNRS